MNLVWELTFFLMPMPERRGKKRGSFFFHGSLRDREEKYCLLLQREEELLRKTFGLLNPIYAHARWEGGRGLPRGKNI